MSSAPSFPEDENKTLSGTDRFDLAESLANLISRMRALESSAQRRVPDPLRREDGPQAEWVTRWLATESISTPLIEDGFREYLMKRSVIRSLPEAPIEVDPEGLRALAPVLPPQEAETYTYTYAFPERWRDEMLYTVDTGENQEVVPASLLESSLVMGSWQWAQIRQRTLDDIYLGLLSQDRLQYVIPTGTVPSWAWTEDNFRRCAEQVQVDLERNGFWVRVVRTFERTVVFTVTRPGTEDFSAQRP